MKSQKILNHTQYSESDYDRLKSKGYSNKEIVYIWDNDKKAGKNPVGYQTAPDLLGINK